MNLNLVSLAKKYEKYLLEMRARLHRIPELRFQTEKTRDLIINEVIDNSTKKKNTLL